MLEIGDQRIAGMHTGGRGMPLLMLHGSGGSKDVFARQFESLLGEDFRLVAIDLPGHGASSDASNPDQAYTIRGLTATVSAVVDQLELEGAAVYGWSLGGHVAIELAARRGDLAGLALSGTPPIGRGPIYALRAFHARWDLLLASKEVFSERDAVRFSQLCYADQGTTTMLDGIRRADGRLRKHFLRSLMQGDCADQKRFVEHADLPIAMINGADDPLVRQSYIEHLDYARLWRGRCDTIVGAAHAPFWQQPEKVNALLHRYLRELAFARSTGKGVGQVHGNRA